MTKRMTIVLLSLLCITMAVAQNYDIKGVVTDTLGEPLLGSTIMLLDMDSIYVDFARTELDGSFRFKNVPQGDHLVRITFVGFIPATLNASYRGKDVDLGTVQLHEIATELMEVVIKAAKAPIKLRGDTIEYDATTFKVPEGSTVEDLLKRLPGIQVDREGEITADGQNVSKVTVDGKKFFGGDPKAATKNLQAEGISKVQVFDTKTEEEEITGESNNANQDKTLNLELKEDYKSGAFGKIIAGYGTEERGELKGNYNRFNDKIQFSLIGVANNTGRNGLSWDDYQGFMGSEAWSFDNEGTYGFGSGGMRFMSFGGEDKGLESSLQNIFFSGSQTGLPSTLNGGTNFNWEDKKAKINAYYFINQKGLERNRKSEKETFLELGNAFEESTSESESTAIGHRGEIAWEQEIDSFHTIILKTQVAAVNNEGVYFGNSSSRFLNNNFITNTADYDNDNTTDGHLLNGRILIRKKFKSNKRRRMGANASYQYSTINENQNQYSINEFFDEVGLTSRNVLDQNYDNIASKKLLQANGLYVEPLGEKFSFRTFYNFSNRQENGDRQVVDLIDNTESVNTFLTRNYENDITLNRIGSSINYSYEGFNLSVGAAFQSFLLEGIYEGVSGSNISGTIDQVYNIWIPNASINFSPIRNSYFKLSYSVSAQEPSIRNLQPVIDNSNPLYLREGNPDLVPEIDHSFNTYFSFSRPLSGFRVYFNGNYSFFTDQIITEETIDDNLVTYVRPINYDGGNRSYFSTGINFPIKKNKLTMNIGISTNFNNTNTFVNKVLNESKTSSYSPRASINYTPGENFALYLDGRWQMSETKYSVNSALDQSIHNIFYGMEMNATLLWGFKLNSDFRVRQYRNDRLDLDQDIPILNISIYKQFLKGNKGELRLSLYDALNKNVAISQFASNYFISQSETVTLARYGMLSFTYNIKGLKAGIKRDRWH